MLMNNTNPDGTRWSPAACIIYEMMNGVKLSNKDKKELDRVKKCFPPAYTPSWNHRRGATSADTGNESSTSKQDGSTGDNQEES